MKASSAAVALPPLELDIRAAESDAELRAVAALRARSFYVYPPERRFAGERYQAMKAEEEFAELVARRESGAAAAASGKPGVCLLASAPRAALDAPLPEELLLNGGRQVLTGTLDVLVARSVRGEALVGRHRHAAYMLNVCTADAARRRGVGTALVAAAKRHARSFGVGVLYVHLMAVNEVGRALYEACGFSVEQEETSNQAHYRGHCLDGIEGRGRTILMKADL